MIDREILAQVRRIQVRTKGMVTEVMTGGYTSVFRGTGIEFDEVREFVEGDDVRSVDWNVTARTGRPHIKKRTAAAVRAGFRRRKISSLKVAIERKAWPETGPLRWAKSDNRAARTLSALGQQ